MIAGIGKHLTGESALVTEALAVKEGLKLARNKGLLSNVVFEMDSELVYKSVVSADNRADWRLSPVLADIRSLADHFSGVKFKCVKRKANMAADWVATRSRMGMCFADLSQNQPSSLVHILCKDGLPAPHSDFV
ncbi:hypothetical protein COLO4_28853 [Corchorus olitorius]|uniref:RNase H type-1 domain-containing protein n=1 Tax=Corchorus olitorius TaxID=93759 RepID=A0A1R3HI00_9ROSI|nr:hypothetical protein COLO4_28853 [Corchorus olitorius]